MAPNLGWSPGPQSSEERLLGPVLGQASRGSGQTQGRRYASAEGSGQNSCWCPQCPLACPPAAAGSPCVPSTAPEGAPWRVVRAEPATPTVTETPRDAPGSGSGLEPDIPVGTGQRGAVGRPCGLARAAPSSEALSRDASLPDARLGQPQEAGTSAVVGNHLRSLGIGTPSPPTPAATGAGSAAHHEPLPLRTPTRTTTQGAGSFPQV